jgi:hypothetical protein
MYIIDLFIKVDDTILKSISQLDHATETLFKKVI